MNTAATRVVSLTAAPARLAEWRAAGQRVVVVRGVFDLIEVGHVRAVAGIRREGDRLVIVVAADRDATSLGPGRPVVAADDRAAVVAALRGVDVVVVEENAALDDVVRRLAPDLDLGSLDESEPRDAPAAGSVRYDLVDRIRAAKPA